MHLIKVRGMDFTLTYGQVMYSCAALPESMFLAWPAANLPPFRGQGHLFSRRCWSMGCCLRAMCWPLGEQPKGGDATWPEARLAISTARTAQQYIAS